MSTFKVRHSAPVRLRVLLISCGTGESHIQAITISILPDDVLLEILDFWVSDVGHIQWRLLGHVCRRWRQLVFASPQRLNLRILYTHKTPVKTDLDIWPTFPITIIYSTSLRFVSREDRSRLGVDDNIIAAFGSPFRCLRISTSLPTGAMMSNLHQSFPSIS